MNENITDHSLSRVEAPEVLSRRRFLEKLSIALGSLCAAVVGLPLIGFVIAPLFRKVPEQWVTLGKVGDFQIGNTVSVTVVDPSSLPWAGITAKSAVWLRRESASSFTAFSANCTHLGCPVRWMEGAELFMCPCHGGVYYSDGSVAAGPPPRPLFRYNVRVENGEVKMNSVVVPISTAL
jgi:quinol---cytochrome c reductase iron-sulfur subunit, bacillus type